MNRMLLALILILSVLSAAAIVPQAEVQLLLQDGQYRVGEVVYGDAQDPTWAYGDWTLLLLDDADTIVSQTTFSPTADHPADTSLADELWVSVRWTPAAERLEVLDGEGERRLVHAFAEVCGNNRCAPSERGFCSADCPLARELELAEAERPEYLEPVGMGWRAWAIGGAALLIVVLVLVLIHVNRSRENPVKLQSSLE